MTDFTVRKAHFVLIGREEEENRQNIKNVHVNAPHV